MIYGYCRCSTDETKQDINRQVRELKAQGAKDESIYLEYQSGTKCDRIELTKVLSLLKSGDTLLATEVSRITRSTSQLCSIVEMAKEKKVKLILGNFIVDCTDALDPMTEGMLKMMGVFAELERNMTVQRIKSGMANAKAKGKRIGRPKLSQDIIPQIFYRYYPKYKNREISKVELGRLCKLARSSVYRYLSIVDGEIAE
jgi:DNA invertase Pin-like site-specific DNA recombinase